VTAQAQPVRARQHEVKYDEANTRRFERSHHRLAIVRNGYPIAVLRQEPRQQRADLFVVVDDQQVRKRVHDGNCLASNRFARAEICNLMLQATAL
jgi:hypothetical protein